MMSNDFSVESSVKVASCNTSVTDSTMLHFFKIYVLKIEK